MSQENILFHKIREFFYYDYQFLFIIKLISMLLDEKIQLLDLFSEIVLFISFIFSI